MHIKDIPAGTSWGCKFKTTTFLNELGKPIEAYNLALRHRKRPCATTRR
jgi:hypothetical protein